MEKFFFEAKFSCMAWPDGGLDYGKLLLVVTGENDSGKARGLAYIVAYRFAPATPDGDVLPTISPIQECHLPLKIQDKLPEIPTDENERIVTIVSAKEGPDPYQSICDIPPLPHEVRF